jgi:Holliday junction DNA helicase RuvA
MQHLLYYLKYTQEEKMIDEIKGLISKIDEKSLTVLVGGIGLKIWTTTNVVNQSRVGEQIHLATDLVLRETEISLYGFLTASDRDMFRTLIKVNGVGPKAAISILSTMPIATIYNAIRSKDFHYFTQVPGIGSKTAQKLILYLQDSLQLPDVMQLDPDTASVNADLLEALVGLGYSVVEAQSCIQHIPENTPDDLESRLRIALQYFS